MFNRLPFNRGKFNTGTAESGNAGNSRLRLGGQIRGTMQIDGRPQAIQLKLTPRAELTLQKQGLPQTAGLHLGLAGAYAVTKYAQPAALRLALKSSGAFALIGEVSLTLTGLSLKPGDTLVIDTCAYTVTVNSQDAMYAFADVGDFFTLLPGENTITFEDDAANRTLQCQILWKPRWL